MINPRTIAFLGRSGSGKDTQARLLSEILRPNLYISTGGLGRELIKKDTLVAHRAKETLDAGEFFPVWLAEVLWQREILERVKGEEHIIFPSSPRKKPEAEKIDEVLSWLKRDLSEAILVDIPEEEATKRLLGRGRFDDTEEDIRGRLDEFNKYVVPTIDYYEKEGRLHRIDGVGKVEDIFDRIKQALNLE